MLVLVYVSVVAFVMSHAQMFLGEKDTAWTPVAVLMLFVLSAAVVGTLVVGAPVFMYLEGKKTEALKFLGYIIGWLFVLTIIVFVLLAVKK